MHLYEVLHGAGPKLNSWHEAIRAVAAAAPRALSLRLTSTYVKYVCGVTDNDRAVVEVLPPVSLVVVQRRAGHGSTKTFESVTTSLHFCYTPV